jgi:hypothetical protein
VAGSDESLEGFVKVGDVFGQLTVKNVGLRRPKGSSGKSERVVRVQCACGIVFLKRPSDLTGVRRTRRCKACGLKRAKRSSFSHPHRRTIMLDEFGGTS